MSDQMISTGEVVAASAGVLVGGIDVTKFQPDHGQWVKFRGDVPEAHRTNDGFVLGVYQRQGAETATVTKADGTVIEPGPELPARVVPVDEHGKNIYALVKNKDGLPEAHVVFVELGHCRDLHPMTDRNDVPAARLATYHPDWHPKAHHRLQRRLAQESKPVAA